MLKRDWRIYFAALGALALVAFVAASVVVVWSQYQVGRQSYQEYNGRTYKDQQQTADHIAAKCNFATAPASLVRECLSADIRAYQDQDTTNQDLQAQQHMAFWAFWMFAASAFGCDLEAAPIDDDAARKYGVMLRESISTINAFNENLRAAADSAERAVAEAEDRGDDPREPE